MLSLENHCSPSQQEVMADNLQSVFGDALLSDVLDDCPDRLPSPEVTFCLRSSAEEKKKEKACHYYIGPSNWARSMKNTYFFIIYRGVFLQCVS